MINGIIKKGIYFDSVSLMLVSQKLNQLPGVSSASVVMGTRENLAILRNAGLEIQGTDQATDTDLIIAIESSDEASATYAIGMADNYMHDMRNQKNESTDQFASSFEGALAQMPDAQLALISVAGKYAAAEALKAINSNLHVMIFSDNVSIEDELMLKTKALAKGLLVMGPDCGTAIINGIPLAFANVVNRGNIGLVGASGTGLQEVTSIISMQGGGISQAIGTGGRDVKEAVGGIMFMSALKALAADTETKVICLVSKPPHEAVLERISEQIKTITKPVVAVFIGASEEVLKKSGAIPARTLEEAALMAFALANGQDAGTIKQMLGERRTRMQLQARQMATAMQGRYLRGLFSGGTLCDEAQLILRDTLGFVYSNTPLHPEYVLENALKSNKHTIIDMGDDAFTAGRPHPMIDFSLRMQRLVAEARDSDTALILFDVVLGFGAHMDPAAALLPAIQEAHTLAPAIHFVCSITGTGKDPQKLSQVKAALEGAGVVVMPSNAAAAELCAMIFENLNNK